MSSAPFHRRIALATCVVLSAVPLSSALAQQPPRGEQGRAEMMERGERGNRGDERSLSDAVRRVQRTTGGHILGAERVPFDGRDMTRIKVLDETGRVRVITEAPKGPRPPR